MCFGHCFISICVPNFSAGTILLVSKMYLCSDFLSQSNYNILLAVVNLWSVSLPWISKKSLPFFTLPYEFNQQIECTKYFIKSHYNISMICCEEDLKKSLSSNYNNLHKKIIMPLPVKSVYNQSSNKTDYTYKWE